MNYLFHIASIIPFIILDIVSYLGFKRAFPQFALRYYRQIRYVFLIQAVFSMIILLGGHFLDRQVSNYRLIAWYYYFFGIVVTLYLPKGVFMAFLFVDLIFATISKFQRRLFDKFPRGSRCVFAKCGFWTSVVFAFIVVWGILFGRNNFSVDHVGIYIDELPSAFHGYKIVHISDLHAGSFAWSTDRFQKAVDLINQQEPNLIVCTGDMVNNFAAELTPLIPVFSQLKAPDGKYAVLGNHDYGGYYDWNHPADSIADHEALKNAIEQMGFALLNNQSVVISRYNSDKMALIGVENWGKEKRFPKRANLIQAMESVHDIPFKVLLVHDPLFWHYFVEGKTDIALTLAGHTHGMQIGVKFRNKRYSVSPPERSRFLEGLYSTDTQNLYVNRGLGVIGFPGRIGMPPEITVISLWKVRTPEQQ